MTEGRRGFPDDFTSGVIISRRFGTKNIQNFSVLNAQDSITFSLIDEWGIYSIWSCLLSPKWAKDPFRALLVAWIIWWGRVFVDRALLGHTQQLPP